MVYFISIIHALTCIFVVLFILLQDPKGGVLGVLGGGGGGKSLFGTGGASQFLVQITKWLAIIFACTSFYLSYMSSKQDSSLFSDTENLSVEQPVKKPATQQPQKKPPSTK